MSRKTCIDFVRDFCVLKLDQINHRELFFNNHFVSGFRYYLVLLSVYNLV